MWVVYGTLAETQEPIGKERRDAQDFGVWHFISLVIVILVSIVARVSWLKSVDTQPVTDFHWYFERAASIASGQGYSVNGQATAYWPVGYPAFLAVFFKLFGPSVALAKTLNTGLTLFCVLTSWLLALRLTRSLLVATMTALILSIHPAFIAYSGILASEPLFTGCVLAGCYFLTGSPSKWKEVVAAGLLFGLATLVRPQAVLVPGIVFGLHLLSSGVDKKGAVKLFGILYLTVALTLVPWSIRNFVVMKSAVFVSTNGGDNLLIGNCELSTGKYLNPDALGYDFRGLNEVERDKAARQEALRYIQRNPKHVWSTWRTKVETTFLTATDSAYWGFQKKFGVMEDPGTGDDKPQYKWFLAYSRLFVPWLAIISAFGLVLGALGAKLIKFSLIGLGFVLYIGLVSLVFFGNPRFGFPAVPFLAIYAAQGFVVVLTLAFKAIAGSRKS